MGGAYSLYDVIEGLPEVSLDHASRRVYFVTGATSGVGLTAVKALLLAGAKEVYMGCRNLELANKIKTELPNSERAFILHLDLLDFESVKKCASEFLHREKKLNVLVLNAGMIAPEWKASKQGFESQIQTNHLGHALLVKLLEHVLSKSGSHRHQSRLIFVASEAHRYTGGVTFEGWSKAPSSYSSFGTYCETKLCNILYAKHLSLSYPSKNIIVCSLHPGFVDTEFGRNNDCLMGCIKSLSCCCILTPDEGAATTAFCALSPKAKNGTYYSDCSVKEPSRTANDEKLMYKLVDETESALKPYLPAKVKKFRVKKAPKN